MMFVLQALLFSFLEPPAHQPLSLWTTWSTSALRISASLSGPLTGLDQSESSLLSAVCRVSDEISELEDVIQTAVVGSISANVTVYSDPLMTKE